MSRCVSARPLLRGERIGELVTGIEPGLPDAQQLPVTPTQTAVAPVRSSCSSTQILPLSFDVVRDVCGSSSFFQSWSV